MISVSNTEFYWYSLGERVEQTHFTLLIGIIASIITVFIYLIFVFFPFKMYVLDQFIVWPIHLADMNGSLLRALIACYKHATVSSASKSGRSNIDIGDATLSPSLLSQALCHSDDQVCAYYLFFSIRTVLKLIYVHLDLFFSYYTQIVKWALFS